MKKQSSLRFNLYVKFALIVAGGLLLISALWVLVFIVVDLLFDVDVEFFDNLWLIVCSLFLGGVFSGYIGKKFLDPIAQLGQSMGKVSKGDFTVEIQPKSKMKEIQKIYDDFNLMVKELRATEILQTDFASNVSHEFKTPITAIEGYAMLLQGEEDVSPQQKEYIQKILFNTQRLSALVGNILLLSKLDNQAIPCSKSSFRLDEQIRQTIFAFETEWAKKAIEFDVELQSIVYSGYEPLLQSVWKNLVENAIKFSPYGGTVKLSLKKENDTLTFAISDEGAGISKESAAHIFDKFYQGDTSHKQEGNGLGLALVKQIVTLSQGRVWAENLSGGGCKFTVELPAEE